MKRHKSVRAETIGALHGRIADLGAQVDYLANRLASALNRARRAEASLEVLQLGIAAELRALASKEGGQ